MTHHHATIAEPRRRSLFSRFNRTPRTSATARPARTSRFGRTHRTSTTTQPAYTSGIGHTNQATAGPTTGATTGATTGHRHTEKVVVPGRRSRFGFRHRPEVVEKRRATLGDKISGAMLRLRGSLSGRPDVEVAGARRMHGTDERMRHY